MTLFETKLLYHTDFETLSAEVKHHASLGWRLVAACVNSMTSTHYVWMERDENFSRHS